MIDLNDTTKRPTLEEIGQYINNPVFIQFCSEIKNTYACKETIEFSSCSWEKGWNIKFKKAGKTLCTIYPREYYFTVMVVIGRKEKESVEKILPGCSSEMRDLYHQTPEGNGQRWLTADLEDHADLYRDLLRFIHIRRNSRNQKTKGIDS